MTQQTAFDFEAKLQEIATRIKRSSRTVLAEMTRKTTRTFDTNSIAEFEQAALVAAFNAFLELGGDPNAPETFDWNLHQTALRSKGREELRHLLLGPGSDYSQFRRRYRVRAHAIKDSATTWKAWDRLFEPTATDVDGSELKSADERGVLTIKPEYITDQELHLHESRLAELETALREVLTEPQADMMISHYIHGVRQIDIARFRLLARGVTDPTEDQLSREENAVNQNLRRARVRAAELLDPSWRDYASVSI